MIARIRSKRPPRLYVRERMELVPMDQKRLADRMGCSESTVSKKLNNPESISIAWLRRFADALDVTVPELFIDPTAPTRDELLAAGTPEELRQAIQLVRMAKAS